MRGLDLKVIALIQAKLGGAKSTLNNQQPIIIYTKIKDGKTKKKKIDIGTSPLHAEIGIWEWDQCHLLDYMVAQYEYHPDQELHQHVHESKQSAVQPKVSCNTPDKAGFQLSTKFRFFKKLPASMQNRCKSAIRINGLLFNLRVIKIHQRPQLISFNILSTIK